MIFFSIQINVYLMNFGHQNKTFFSFKSHTFNYLHPFFGSLYFITFIQLETGSDLVLPPQYRAWPACIVTQTEQALYYNWLTNFKLTQYPQN